jgi:penicillin-binding protein 1C
LANQGRVRPLHFRADAPVQLSRALLSPVAAWYLTDILREAPLPPGFLVRSHGVAFKTGTSYGFRDAWAIGYDAGHTVGIWMGRPDGGYTADLSGLESTVPVMLAVFGHLPRAGLQSLLSEPPPGVSMADNSGLPLPLRRFGTMMTGPAPTAGGSPRIVYPPADSEIELGSDGVVIIRAAGGEGPFHWLLDGRPLEQSEGRDLVWTPSADGTRRVTVIDSQGRSAGVRFRVYYNHRG